MKKSRDIVLASIKDTEPLSTERPYKDSVPVRSTERLFPESENFFPRNCNPKPSNNSSLSLKPLNVKTQEFPQPKNLYRKNLGRRGEVLVSIHLKEKGFTILK